MHYNLCRTVSLPERDACRRVRVAFLVFIAHSSASSHTVIPMFHTPTITGPLLRHRLCNAGKCLRPDLLASLFPSLKPPVSSVCIFTAPIHIRLIILHDFRRKERRQALQPQARPFTVCMSEIIGLDHLVIRRQSDQFHRCGIFNRNSRTICIIKLHEKRFCLHRFLITFCHNLPV